jgi:hypothetical protein
MSEMPASKIIEASMMDTSMAIEADAMADTAMASDERTESGKSSLQRLSVLRNSIRLLFNKKRKCLRYSLR